MIPFAAVTYHLITSINTLGIRFAEKELQGIKFCDPLMRLLLALQQHRELALLRTQSNAIISIDKLVDSIDEVNRQAEENLHISAKWRALHEECLKLKDIPATAAPPE